MHPYMNDLAPEISTFKLQGDNVILHAASGTLALWYGDIYEVQPSMY